MHLVMNRSYRILLTVILLLMPFIVKSSDEGVKLVILHTNDMHSRLEGFSPSGAYTPGSVNDDMTVGGFSRIASIIERERNSSPGNILVLDDGDFLMGTIFHYMEEYNGFQLQLMKDMGYDLVAIGNHEFDYGPKKLADIINASLAGGDIPSLLLTNAVFDEGASADDGLAGLYDDGVIGRTTIIERGGVKIGFFALMGEDADEVAPFAVPVTFEKQARSARRAARELRKDGADIVICLSHSGVERSEKKGWAGEDVELARKVKDIDLIISGHTHTLLTDPIVVKGTPIVQAGSFGRNVGKVELTISNGKISIDNYSLIPVDDSVLGNAEIESRIDEQKELIKAKLMEPLGYDPTIPLIESSFELICDEYGGDLENSNLGPLVADAIHSYINSNSDTGTDISMVATGVIRDNIPAGILSVQDIFRIMSLGSGDDGIPGYPLATVYLNGRELKRVIEILLVAYKSSPSNYCYYSGLEVTFNPDKGLLRKVNSIDIVKTDGTKESVDFSGDDPTLYSVSANSYMLEFIGIIKKKTFGFVNVLPKKQDGSPMTDMLDARIDFDNQKPGLQEGKEWIALVDYLAAMIDIDGDSIPDMDDYYRKPPYRVIPQLPEK